jgi:hypothetical protein
MFSIERELTPSKEGALSNPEGMALRSFTHLRVLMASLGSPLSATQWTGTLVR